MQEQDFNKEFDLKIRSMLEDAQEDQVPPRVWDAVSASLDKAQKKPVVLWWRRAAVSAVAAAAVAAGVIVSVRNDNSTSPYINPKDASAEAAAPESDIAVVENKTVKDEPLIARASEPSTPARQGTYQFAGVPQSASQAAKSQMEEVPKGESSPVGNKVQEPARDVKTEANENVTVKKEQETSPALKEQPKEKDPATEPSRQSIAENRNDAVAQADPFAALSAKDSKKSSSKPSIVVGGVMQSNGDPSSSSSFGPSMASGTNVQTGVTQTSKESTYSIPVTLGVGVRFPLSQRLSLGTGLNYSFMERTFQGVYTKVGDNGTVTTQVNTDIHNTLHYIGIPLNLYYNILSGDRVSLYGYGGGTLEKGLANRYRLTDGGQTYRHSESVNGVQFSLGAGLGVGFKIWNNISLYIDPSLRYFFDCNQPTSIRTQQPLMFNFEVGLKMDL